MSFFNVDLEFYGTVGKEGIVDFRKPIERNSIWPKASSVCYHLDDCLVNCVVLGSMNDIICNTDILFFP